MSDGFIRRLSSVFGPQFEYLIYAGSLRPTMSELLVEGRENHVDSVLHSPILHFSSTWLLRPSGFSVHT